MKLTFYQGPEPNFGDELNVFMWDKLLPPGFLDDDASDLFVGVGSILWDSYSTKSIKHVMGSGYGGYTPPPDMSDGTWQVAWVRGPLTAQKMGLDPSLAITDSAVLLRAIDMPPPPATSGPAFMPHFESVARGNWEQVCKIAGVTYLDPRGDPLTLISQIRAASVLVTEAMHGAIVADAMRTPFIAVTPTHHSHRYKWEDWARSMNLTLKPVDTTPSSMLEGYVKLTGLEGQGKRSTAVLNNPVLRPAQALLTGNAARKLTTILQTAEPQLSSDAVISSLTERSLDALNKFVSGRTQASPL